MEDGGREDVKAGHHEIGGWVLWFLDDVGDLAVRVGVTDAVATRVLPEDFLDEKSGVGAVLTLAADDVFEVGLEDVVPEHEYEVLLNVVFGGKQAVGKSLLFALVGIGDGDILEGVAVVLDDVLFTIADDDDEFVGAECGELLETVRQDGFAIDLDHSFGLVLREGAESGSLAGCQHDCFHDYLIVDACLPCGCYRQGVARSRRSPRVEEIASLTAVVAHASGTRLRRVLRGRQSRSSARVACPDTAPASGVASA